MTSLSDRIANVLQGGRALTMPELGRELRVRDVAVREVLRVDPRFEPRPAPPTRSARARLWMLAPGSRPAPGTSGTSAPGSDAVHGPVQPSEARESLWWLALPAGHPRSVAEAIRAADRRRAAA